MGGIDTYQWRVIHTVDDDTLVFRCVFSNTPQMGFQYMIPVEEGHLSIRFYPDLQPKSVRLGWG